MLILKLVPEFIKTYYAIISIITCLGDVEGTVIGYESWMKDKRTVEFVKEFNLIPVRKKLRASLMMLGMMCMVR